MDTFNFSGGIHPPELKNQTKDLSIKEFPVPEKVVIPLSQHTGAPAIPIVQKGDIVVAGQKIGESQGKISANVHSSISGEVVDILPYNHPVVNKPVPAIIVKSDGKNFQIEIKKTYWDYYRYSPQDIIKVIQEAGIVGLGGAAFPTHVKLSPPKEKEIDTLLLNGCECEPCLTCDDRLMQENPKEIIEGMKIIMFILNIHKGIVVIEDNKKNAIEAINKIVFLEPNISVKIVKTKYPQGAEKQLIKTVLNREVPSGGLPFDVGVIVQNVGTSYAIYQAVVKGLPLTSRVITVAGDFISNPGNYRVPIGTLASDILSYCGYKPEEKPHKIIFGGPMMGISQGILDVPILKGTSGIIVQESKNIQFFSEYDNCIHCGKCVDVCPMELMPNFLSYYAEHMLWEKCKEFFPNDCIECGCCAYECPAKRPIVQHIKLAKFYLSKK